MLYTKEFATPAEGDGYVTKTPFVGTVEGVEGKALYVPESLGDEVEIMDDGRGFIKIKPENKIIAKYNVTTTSNATRLYSSQIYSTNCIMYIDDIETPIATGYTFSETGEHTVRFLFKDRLTNCSYMFSNCGNLISLDLSSFDTSKVTSLNSMFSSCSGLTSLDLSYFDTRNVTSMSSIFHSCSSLTGITFGEDWDTSKATVMSYMFCRCMSLTSLDLSNFNTNIVTNMSNMFKECSGLTSLDLSMFNTSNVTDMSQMFYNCKRITDIDLSNFDTRKVTTMSYMFYNCGYSVSPKAFNVTYSSTIASNITTLPTNNPSYITFTDIATA